MRNEEKNNYEEPVRVMKIKQLKQIKHLFFLRDNMIKNSNLKWTHERLGFPADTGSRRPACRCRG